MAVVKNDTEHRKKSMDLDPFVKYVHLVILDANTALSTGDKQGNIYFIVDNILDGMDLFYVRAIVDTASSSGDPTFQIRNVTNSNADMLSTRVTIDATETDSKDDANAFAIDTTKANVANGDKIAIDGDVSGTGTKGLYIILGFKRPVS